MRLPSVVATSEYVLVARTPNLLKVNFEMLFVKKYRRRQAKGAGRSASNEEVIPRSSTALFSTQSKRRNISDDLPACLFRFDSSINLRGLAEPFASCKMASQLASATTPH